MTDGVDRTEWTDAEVEYERLVAEHYPDKLTDAAAKRMLELEEHLKLETLVSDVWRFRYLLRKLHTEMLWEDEDSEAEARADAIRDKMDPVWRRLTDDQRAAMRVYSVELYHDRDDNPPNLDSLDRGGEGAGGA